MKVGILLVIPSEARDLPEANGEWAMARYIEATEMNDPVEKASVLERIKVYNEEDLDSTLAIRPG